ncbi:MAG: class I SAM-dependent methyltransferase [Proteobacteria bacterium]|nr:class I SAM-dependent methyltransferase [Pseudomonadota bacterium]
MREIVDLLTHAAESKMDVDFFSSIKGFLNPMEGYALCLLAALGPGTGEAVEIGSFLGKSTCYLALGCKAADRGRVTAVDHFLGSPEHQQGMKHEERCLVQDGSLLHQFKRNIETMGLAGHVRTMPLPSLQAATQWSSPIRLLFIDGDHSYQASRADFEAWSPLVEENGLIVFHDIGGWEGVTRFHSECTSSGSAYRTVLACGSIRVVERRA